MKNLLKDSFIIVLFSAFIFYCAGKTSNEKRINADPPNPPSNIRVSFSVKADLPQAVIYWADNSQDEEGFRIYARRADETSYKLISAVPPDTTSYLDTVSVMTKTYYYRVNAFNGNGESATDVEGLRLGHLATINKSNIVDYDMYGTILMLLSADGISSIDLKDPGEPVFIKTLPLKGSVKKGFIKLAYPRAYATDGADLHVLDMEDPASLSIVSAVSLPFIPVDLEFYKNVLFLLGEEGLSLMGMEGIKPRMIRSLKTGSRLQNIAISENFLFAANSREGVWVYDLADPKNPVLKTKYTPQPQRYFSSVSIWNEKILASVRDFENALQVISFRTEGPSLLGSVSLNWTPLDTCVSKNVILVPESEAGVEMILAIDPSRMKIIGNIESEVNRIKTSNGLVLASYHDNFYIFSTP